METFDCGKITGVNGADSMLLGNDGVVIMSKLVEDWTVSGGDPIRPTSELIEAELPRADNESLEKLTLKPPGLQNLKCFGQQFLKRLRNYIVFIVDAPIMHITVKWLPHICKNIAVLLNLEYNIHSIFHCLEDRVQLL